MSEEKKFRILMVCHGNICRSPMAEFIMKAMVKERGIENQFHIESAAVSTEEIGNGIYPPARSCLSFHNIPFDRSRTAWQIRRSDYDRFDLIICMDRSNLRWMRYIISEDPENKIHLMMSFADAKFYATNSALNGGITAKDVADPWYTDDFETTYRDLTLGCTGLLNFLKKS